MYPYDKLLPLEKAIVDFRMTHPTLYAIITIAIVVTGIIGLVYIERRNARIQQEKHKAERASKRAWIKAQGGL